MKVKKRHVIGAHILNFAIYYPLYIVLSVALAIALAPTPIPRAPYVWLCILSPIALNYWIVSRRINRLKHASEFMTSKIKSSLDRVDYFNVGTHGAIAVDADSKNIAVISASQNLKTFSAPFIFGSVKIQNYAAFSPGYTELVSTGGGLLSSEQELTSLRNREAKAKANSKTGLYIDLDDLRTPKVFVQMDYDHADKWCLIIKKLSNGSLEIQSSPMNFPTE